MNGGAEQRSTDALDVQRLVTDYLIAAGAVVEPRAYALVEVLLPDDLASELGGRPDALLAFDLEVAHENPGSVFVTFGHPFLDRVLRGCLGLGRARRRYASAARCAPPADLPARIQASLRFVGGRGALLDVQVEEQHAAWFQFHLTMSADEKREQVAGVLVDLHACLPVDHLAPVVARAFWDERPGAALPAPETVAPAEAYRAAAAHLERGALREALARFQRELQPYLARELARVQRYYDGLAGDLRRRIELADDPERRAKLEEKLAASEADRQRRVKDLEDKYRPRASVALDAVTWYVWPRARARLAVRRRDGTYEVDAYYDLLGNCVQPLPCSACGTWSRAVDFTPDGRLRCAGGCAAAPRAAAAAQGAAQ